MIHGQGGGGRGTIEVQGYVLAPQNAVPADAVGYAVPVFRDRAQAARFCPIYRSKLTFAGSLKSGTPLHVVSYGQSVDIAPFVWPVTQWTAGEKPDCALLVERYNISGAKVFYDIAQKAIVDNGGQPPDALAQGPFIVTARRVSGAIMVYDLSEAPDGDYGKWMSTSISQLSNPTITMTKVVRPVMRDRVRAFVFGILPAFDGVLEILVPGYKKAREDR